MPSTPTFSLPYPALTDPPNGPTQMQALALQVEEVMSLRPVSSLPAAGDYTNQLLLSTADNRFYRWTGSAWVKATAHARYVRTAALAGGNWTGDKQMSFPTQRSGHPAIVPSGGSGDTQNTYFTLDPGPWTITAGCRSGGTPQVSIATGTAWAVGNVIAAGSGGALNDNVSVDIEFTVPTAVCVNVFNSSAFNVITGFGDATFISFKRGL